MTKLNVQNWLNYNLPQSWSIPLKILFTSQWFLAWDQCTFHDKTWQTIQYGNCTFSLNLLSTKLIGFQEHLLTIICFLTNGPPTCSSFFTLDVYIQLSRLLKLLAFSNPLTIAMPRLLVFNIFSNSSYYSTPPPLRELS